MGRLIVLFSLYLSSVLLWVMGSWPSVLAYVWFCYRCMFPVHYPPQVIIVSPLALRMVFLFLPCLLLPKKCLPKCGIPIASVMVEDSGDLLAGTYCSLGRLGRGEIQTASVQATAQGLKLKAFVLTPKFLQAHRVLPSDTKCWCCRRRKHQRSIDVIHLYSPFFPYIFPAENGFICLLYVVLQLWYFAWKGKFKNLLNFSRHVPFWTLEALTTSSRWPDPCEWCFTCFSWMCHPGPSMLCFSLRLLNSRHVSSLSTLGLASRSVGCSLSRISVICLAAVGFFFPLGFRQKGDTDFKVLS